MESPMLYSSANKKAIPVAILALILGIFVGTYTYQFKHQVPARQEQNAQTAQNNLKKDPENVQTVITGTSGIVLEAVDDSSEQVISTAPIPNLDRLLVFKSPIPDEIRNKMEIDFSHLTLSLKKDPTRFNDWIDLGLIYSSVTDYEGARFAWEYASTLRPKNSLTFSNLGFLYGYQLKDVKKAEENYLKAIDNEPKLDYLYFRAFEFYRDVLQDKVKATNIIEKGATLLPDRATDLRMMLQTL